MKNFFTFSPSVEEVGSFYVVAGVNVQAMETDLKTNFGTSVIFSKLVTKLSSRTFKIHRFFMVEFAWILEHLTTQKDKRTVNRYRVGMLKYRQLYDEVKEKTWIKSTFEKHPKYDLDKALQEFAISPYPDQREFLEDYSRIKYGYQLKGCLLDAVVGSGKAQPLSSKIKIPGGWSTMGEMKIGDVVTGGDGLPTNVIAIFPQGEQDIYEFTSADGRKSRATLDHVWNVWVEAGNSARWRQMTTKEIIEKRKSSSHFLKQTFIPMFQPELGTFKELPIDPWALGAILGDGGLSQRDVRFTSADDFVVKKLAERLGKEFLVKHRKHSGNPYDHIITTNPNCRSLQSVFRELDLMGKLSIEKSIPEEYMNGSLEQRWELLRGLMDTDGSAEISGKSKLNGDNNGTPTFNTSSEKLAKQVQELVWSLGGYANLTSRIPKFTYKGENKIGARAYRVWIRIPSPKRCFSLPRQVERVPEETQYSKSLKLRIDKIELVGREEAQCIKLDSASELYVTDDFMVTHNTPTSLMWSKMISPYKTFIITPRNLITTPWLLEIDQAFKNKKKIWTSIDGTNILDHLNAEFFVVHKEQLRDANWDLAIKAVTKSGKEPAKVIVDESHNYAEHSSQQSKGLVEFGTNKFISDVLFMSGTPIKAQGKETYTLFATIDKFFDEKVRTSFLKLYGRDNSYLNEMLAHRLGRIKFTIPAITEMNNPPEPVVIKVKFPGVEKFTLNSIRLDMVAFINDRVKFYREHMPQYITDWEDVVKLYRGIISRDPVALQQLDQYVKIVHHFRAHGYNNFTDSDKSKFAGEIEKQIESHLKGADLKYFRHIKSAVKYVGLKIRGEALGNVLGKARMDAVKETIRHADLPTLVNSVKKKTLVYTSYVEVIKELENHFELNGMKSISVYGDNSKEIDQVVDTFTNDKDVNPLITTFATLREGKPMIMANQIILMNSPFRSFELKQTIARIYRRGQDEECFVYLIDLDTGSEENITSRSIDIMQWSAEQVDQLLGGGLFPGQKFQGFGPIDISGFESREYVWDLAKLDPNLDISLEYAERSVPTFKRQYITDIF